MTDACVITLVGDSNIGKSSLIATYAEKRFPRHFTVPRIIEDQLLATKNSFKIIVRDTIGNDEIEVNEFINKLTYPFTDCFALCYAVNDPKSFNNLFQKWYKIIQNYQYLSIIIVGLKSDLYDCGADHTTESEAILLKDLVKAYDTVICSSVDLHNIEEVFSKAVESCLKQKRNLMYQSSINCCKLEQKKI